MNELQDQVVLVTGSGRGLGQAICLELASAGAVIVAADIRQEAARETVSQLQGPGSPRSTSLALDVSNATEAEGAIRRTFEEYGRLDVVVNNAGIDKTVSVEELSVEEWERIVAVNLSGPFLMAKFALPRMKQQGGGHIVNICSTAAKRAWANAAAYHASKWGLLGLSHALHVEGRPHGVKVTAVVAGGMRTPFLLDRFPDLDPNLLQEPRNVAATIRFLLSQPRETVIPEVTVLPMRETSWP